MGYSWTFIGTFSIPVAKLATLKKKLPAQLTTLDEIREDPNSLNDVIYNRTTLTLRRLVDKSEYQETLDDLRALLPVVAGAAGMGQAALVPFIDAGSMVGGVRFIVSKGVVQETPIKTKKDLAAFANAEVYTELVQRHGTAFDEEPSIDADPGDDHGIRDAVLARLAKVSDEQLLRAAATTAISVEIQHKGVRLAKAYPTAAKLRKALQKGSQEWYDGINYAPLALLGKIDPDAALAFARRAADAGLQSRDPLEKGILPLLGRSTADEDLDRLWTIFERSRNTATDLSVRGEDELAASPHPAVDDRVLKALKAAMDEDWDHHANTPLISILWSRDHAEGVKLIMNAAKTHPYKHEFAMDERARGLTSPRKR
jgi:hypothetical protein